MLAFSVQLASSICPCIVSIQCNKMLVPRTALCLPSHQQQSWLYNIYKAQYCLGVGTRSGKEL